ncbi:amidohydrolase family protein [Microbacterium sp. ZW T5_56]|uniref:amidohydrolase family protein n=1 Tax=Microbacterium sp. ZW T5_56 TaxID=3378081 RepID=UPI0038545F1B
MQILDAHLHLWDPAVLDYDWLSGDLDRAFGPEELAQAVAGMSDDRAFIFMQADTRADQALAEVDWVASLPLPVRGLIAFAPLERGADVADHLAALASRPRVVGVRRLLQSEASGFALTPGFRAGAELVAQHGLVFDACVRGQAQLRDVAALADALPQLSIVLDHLGKPTVGSAQAPASPAAEGWAESMHELAARPNVACKVSGLPGESTGAFSAAQFEPFLDTALEAFGAERLLYASDWPASFAGDTAAGYGAWERIVREWIASRDLDADAVLRTNAERIYGLDAL